MRNNEIDKFKDILQSYYDIHKKKFDRFAVRIVRIKENQLMCEVKLPKIAVMKEEWFVPHEINRIPMNLINAPMPRGINKKHLKIC